MKNITILSFLLLMGGIVKGQNYNDLFTTYKGVNPQQNNGVTQYETLDPNQFYQSIAPQNVQIVNGVYIYQGSLYSIKLRVGVSGLNQNEVVVCGYWDGQNWREYNTSASKIGTYRVPDEIRMGCTHQANILSIGTVYF